MSTKHPWTDRSRLIWHLKTAEQRIPGDTEDLTTAAATAEERHIQLQLAPKPGESLTDPS